MNTGYLSIYLYRLQLHSSKSYTFKNYFTSLVKFLPRYFTLFHVIVNGIVYLISLSDISLLVYRKTTDFCILILYPATLLNSLISSNRFLVETLGILIYGIMSSANSDSFTSSFPIWMTFIYFFLSDCCR